MVSRRVRRRRRQFATVGVLLLAFLVYLAFFSGGGPKSTPPPKHRDASTTSSHTSFPAHSPLNPNWKGSGTPVTLAFGGDVHFEGAVGERLSKNPATALGTTVPQLLAGSQLRMVNLESALTDGTCPQPQNKQYVFYAPPTALTALRSATVTVISQANDHAVDCGQSGLAQGLAAAKSANFPLVGAGANAAQAFAPYRVTIGGQRIAILAATQVIAPNLTSTWTATSSQGGVASALDPTQLVQAVQAARRTSDTVVVYLDWGTETVACPNAQQEPLAQELVDAGADIVVGTGAHVLLGAGYLGSAYVELRPRQSGLLRRHRPGDRRRGAPHHGERAPRPRVHLPPLHHRQRSAPTSDRRPGRQRHPELAGRAQLHEPFGHPDGDPSLREGGDDSLRQPDHHDDDRPGRPGASGATTTTTASRRGSLRQDQGLTSRPTTTPATVTQPTDNAG